MGYLTDYRMEKAEKMLVETDEKTYIIAQEVGYSDPNYFSRAFKKKVGVTPTEFKEGVVPVELPDQGSEEADAEDELDDM